MGGERRVEAAKSLGWTEIGVRVLDIEDSLALMVAKDANRKDLTSSEKYAICGTLRERAVQKGWRKKSFGGRLDAAHQKGRLDEEIERRSGSPAKPFEKSEPSTRLPRRIRQSLPI